MIEEPAKKPLSRWKPGESGNPSGRPKGAKDRRTAWRGMIADELPAILQRLVEAAREGDMQAISLILSRTTPALRPQREPTALPELASATTVSDQARAILSAVAAGEISSDQAAELLAAIANAASAIETDELAARIDALEGRINAHD